MTVQIVLKSEDPRPVDGVAWQVLRGHSVGTVRDPDDAPDALARVRDAHPGVQAYARLDLEESGGGATNTGCATIVCSPRGNAVKPYLVPRRGHLACGVHARFVGFDFVTVDVDHHREDFEVDINRVRIDPDTAAVTVTPLWELYSGGGVDADKDFILRNLPNRVRRFRDAVQAALAKATCYHCREPHYCTYFD